MDSQKPLSPRHSAPDTDVNYYYDLIESHVIEYPLAKPPQVGSLWKATHLLAINIADSEEQQSALHKVE